MSSKIIIVNEKDEIIGTEESSKAKENHIYRASALWIENSKGEALITKRSTKKKYFPGFWDPAVVGTNDEGETYESNIIKEAEEEIGLKNFKFKKSAKVFINEEHRYFFQLFTAIVDKDISEFKLEKEEIDEIRWVKKSELKKWFKEKPEEFLPFTKYWMHLFLK